MTSEQRRLRNSSFLKLPLTLFSTEIQDVLGEPCSLFSSTCNDDDCPGYHTTIIEPVAQKWII